VFLSEKGSEGGGFLNYSQLFCTFATEKTTEVMKHLLTTHNICMRERYKNITFSVMYESFTGGIVEKFNQGSQNKTEKYKNIEALKILANNGRKYRLLPVIQDGDKNPDAFNLLTHKYVDIKVAESTNGKNAVQSALKEANKQKVSELILHLIQKPDSYRQMYYAAKLKLQEGHYKTLETLIIIFPNAQVREYNLTGIRKSIKKTPQK
jgi:hypothetical protein